MAPPSDNRAKALAHVAKYVGQDVVIYEEVLCKTDLSPWEQGEKCQCVCTRHLSSNKCSVWVHLPTGKHFQLGSTCDDHMRDGTRSKTRAVTGCGGPSAARGAFDERVWAELGLFGPLPADYDERCREMVRRWAVYTEYMTRAQLEAERARAAAAASAEGRRTVAALLAVRTSRLRKDAARAAMTAVAANHKDITALVNATLAQRCIEDIDWWFGAKPADADAHFASLKRRYP